MNNQEILATLRRLATDLSELHSGDVLKLDTYSLLDCRMDEPGGVLVRWFNSENDQRTKALLRAVIRIVVKAGVKQENVQANGVELLRLVERLEGKPAKKSRVQPDHEITAWYRVHHWKYKTKSEAVRAYLQMPKGSRKRTPEYLSYYTQLDNDLRKRPLKPTKKQ
jgi:hypothetical protein